MRIWWVCLAACGRFGFSEPNRDAIELGDGSRPDIVFASNVVFVTTPTIVPGALGGLAQADAICQASADQSALPGTYIAWLSTSTVNAIDRLAGSRGWVRTDGTPFADQPSDLVAGTVWSPISLLADGSEQVFADPVVITGTTAAGVAATTTCGNWTSMTGTFTQGFLTATSAAWSEAVVADATVCNVAARLYCFGIGNQVAVMTPGATSRRAFLSTAITSGNGVAPMDDRCRQDAIAASLPGTYRALIATTTMTALSRFTTNGPRWERVDGIPLAPTAPDLAIGFRVPLPIRADGSRDTTDGEAWTGAGDPSTVSVSDEACLDWTSTSVSQGGRLGLVDHAGPKAFTYLLHRRCDDSMHGVYCLQE